jgi:hypothetical protein
MQSKPLNKKYIWDDEELSLPINLLDHVKVNNQPLSEVTKSNKIYIKGKNVIISFKNFFGDLKLEFPDKEEILKIAPKKLFYNQEINPDEGYDIVKHRVLNDIRDFITFIVKEIKDIQTYKAFKIILKDIHRSVEFIVIALEHYLSKLEHNIRLLFQQGPIHKDIVKQESTFGFSLKYSYSSFINPYQTFYRRSMNYSTILNIMVFQSLYYIVLETELLKLVIDDKDLKEKLENLKLKAIKLLDEYHLWEFFYEPPLNLANIQEKLVTQQNPYYPFIFSIYKEIVKMVFSKTVLENIEEGLEYPLINFAYIYEAWAIWRIVHSLRANGFEIIENGILLGKNNKFKRKTKMIFILEKDSKRVYVIWEMKFKPSTDSTYLGDLIRAFNISNVENIEIKPDIVILVENLENKDIEKVVVGDVKFRVDENAKLPRLENIYKVLGYVLDLRRFEVFKNAKFEGLLIYPSTIKTIKIPIMDPKTENVVVYITLVPLTAKQYKIDVDTLIN